MRLHGAVVLKVVELSGQRVEDDPIQELEQDAPERRVGQVETCRAIKQQSSSH